MSENTAGYIRDKMSLKYLILYILSQARQPMLPGVIAGLTTEQGSASVLETLEAIVEMSETGLVFETREKGEKLYGITEKGFFFLRDDERTLLPLSVRTHVQNEIVRLNASCVRDLAVTAKVETQDGGTIKLHLSLSDGKDHFFTTSLLCANREQANTIARRFRRHGETMFNDMLGVLLKEYGDQAN